MSIYISTLEKWQTAQAHEKFGSILNLFSKSALTDLFLSRLSDMEELSLTLRRGVETMIDITVESIVDKRNSGILGDEIPTSMGSFYSLKRLGKNTKNRELSRLIMTYVDNFIEIEAIDGSKEKRHEYIYEVFNRIVSTIIEDLDAPDLSEGPRLIPKEGDFIAGGNGFEVIMGSSKTPHVKYPNGDVSIVVMHDPREGHFIMVERYSPIKGLFLLEFPRISGAEQASMDASVNTGLRNQTGLSIRKIEKIGQISPDSRIIDGHCGIYYGNFDLDDELVAGSKEIRSIKKITEEGLYQAAFEGQIECSLTLASMSVWRAFESIRKKRVANGKRVRVKDD